MKKILFYLNLLFMFPLICGCKQEKISDEEYLFEMKAIIVNVEEKIEVEVIESDYAFGVYWIITYDKTEYYDSNGNSIVREDLNVGDNININYNGQTMMSYPPQIVANKIQMIEKK